VRLTEVTLEFELDAPDCRTRDALAAWRRRGRANHKLVVKLDGCRRMWKELREVAAPRYLFGRRCDQRLREWLTCGYPRAFVKTV